MKQMQKGKETLDMAKKPDGRREEKKMLKREELGEDTRRNPFQGECTPERERNLFRQKKERKRTASRSKRGDAICDAKCEVEEAASVRRM
jgi:hypothetical protein